MLNNAAAGTAVPSGIYQFGLAPEDEARADADQAIASGARTAVALYPLSTWGNRVLTSFRDEFEAQGGRVLGAEGYDPVADDFAAPIEQLLNLVRSNDRRRRLAANLGLTLAFEPRRRQDVDMIFIGADRKTGLLLVPALAFHYAGGVPTYATSEIFDPGRTTSDDDLDGIYFPDAPLLLKPDAAAAALKRSIEGFWPQRAADYIRIYGLGIDAYRLVGALYGGGADAWPVAGVSGTLALDQSGQIHRRMPFAQFRDGRPVAVAEPAEPATPLVRGAPVVGRAGPLAAVPPREPGAAVP